MRHMAQMVIGHFSMTGQHFEQTIFLLSDTKVSPKRCNTLETYARRLPSPSMASPLAHCLSSSLKPQTEHQASQVTGPVGCFCCQSLCSTKLEQVWIVMTTSLSLIPPSQAILLQPAGCTGQRRLERHPAETTHRWPAGATLAMEDRTMITGAQTRQVMPGTLAQGDRCQERKRGSG